MWNLRFFVTLHLSFHKFVICIFQGNVRSSRFIYSLELNYLVCARSRFSRNVTLETSIVLSQAGTGSQNCQLKVKTVQHFATGSVKPHLILKWLCFIFVKVMLQIVSRTFQVIFFLKLGSRYSTVLGQGLILHLVIAHTGQFIINIK